MDWSKHQVLEKSSILLLIGILLAVAIGGLVEIAPLFWLIVDHREGRRACGPTRRSSSPDATSMSARAAISVTAR